MACWAASGCCRYAFRSWYNSQTCCRTCSMAARLASLCGISRASGRSAWTQQAACTNTTNCDAPSLSTAKSGDTPRALRPPSKAPSVAMRTCRSSLTCNSAGQGNVLDRVVALPALQYLQKVDPVLAGGAIEVSEPVIADNGAKAVAPLVPGTGIIRLDVGRHGQRRRQQLRLLLVENFFVFRQDAVELACRNVDVEIVQLF